MGEEAPGLPVHVNAWEPRCRAVQLSAQKNPGKHRIWSRGFSSYRAYFVDLMPAQQTEIIWLTEYGVS